MVATTSTGNHGNGAALNKLMTTKFHASRVLLGLACYVKRAGMKALVEWSARDGNREADALANGDFSEFNLKLCIPLSADTLECEAHNCGE